MLCLQKAQKIHEDQDKDNYKYYEYLKLIFLCTISQQKSLFFFIKYVCCLTVSKMKQFRRFLLKVISKLNDFFFNWCLVILIQCLRPKDLIYDLLSSKGLIYNLRHIL